MTSRQSEEHLKLINNAYEYLRNILWWHFCDGCDDIYVMTKYFCDGCDDISVMTRDLIVTYYFTEYFVTTFDLICNRSTEQYPLNVKIGSIF